MQTYEALKPRWRSGKHTKNWLQIMDQVCNSGYRIESRLTSWAVKTC